MTNDATCLDSSRYPDIDFAADNLRLDDGAWVASGTLTAHGSIDVTVVAVEETGAELSVRASAPSTGTRTASRPARASPAAG
jgi:hypothetical protein